MQTNFHTKGKKFVTRFSFVFITVHLTKKMYRHTTVDSDFRLFDVS